MRLIFIEKWTCEFKGFFTYQKGKYSVQSAVLSIRRVGVLNDALTHFNNEIHAIINAYLFPCSLSLFDVQMGRTFTDTT